MTTLLSYRHGAVGQIGSAALAILIGVVFLWITPARADTALQNKCVAMAKVAQQIADDRDRGVPYKYRQEKNAAIASDMPTLGSWVHSVTKAIYYDMSNLTPADIAIAQVQACINNG